MHNGVETIVLECKGTTQVVGFFLEEAQHSSSIFQIDPGLLARHVPLDNQEYCLAQWDLQPDVLLFLFKDYATQDKYLKRLAFFVEKMGYVGRIAEDKEIALLHGWNAHDYRTVDLARFFTTAEAQSFSLSREELKLREVLLQHGLIQKSGSKFNPGKGALVSIAQESPDYLRFRLLTHELSHALFFSDRHYQDLALSLYESLIEEERWFIMRYFRWMRYNVDSPYLMANEMQAYLVQQPLSEIESYFSENLAQKLIEAHPELTEDVRAYMNHYLPALVSRAKQLGEFLQANYGFAPGALYRIH